MFCQPFKCTYQMGMIIALDLDSEKWIRILFLPPNRLRSHLTSLLSFLICRNGNSSPTIEWIKWNMSLKVFYKLWDTENMENFSEIMETIMLSLNQLFWLIKIGLQRLCSCQCFIHWFNKYWLCTYFLPGTGASQRTKYLE